MSETNDWTTWKQGQIIRVKTSPKTVRVYAGDSRIYDQSGTDTSPIQPSLWEPVPSYNPPPFEVGDRVVFKKESSPMEITEVRRVDQVQTTGLCGWWDAEYFEPAPPEPKPAMTFADAAPELLDEVRRLRAENERLKERLLALCDAASQVTDAPTIDGGFCGSEINNHEHYIGERRSQAVWDRLITEERLSRDQMTGTAQEEKNDERNDVSP